MRINVNTSRGVKFHGEVIGDIFFRRVHHNTDNRKFSNCWAINTSALETIKRVGVKYLIYVDKRNEYRLPIEDIDNPVVRKEEDKVYIPLSLWEIKLRK